MQIREGLVCLQSRSVRIEAASYVGCMQNLPFSYGIALQFSPLGLYIVRIICCGLNLQQVVERLQASHRR